MESSPRSYFDEIIIGDLQIPNRIIMSSLTRMRTDPKDGVPLDAHVKYYADRSDYGIILTECSQISQMGEGHPGSCGIYTQNQVEGWKRVVDQVHEQQGRIFIQLWHCGRVTDTAINNQKEIWAPSAIALTQQQYWLKQPHQIPKEMTLDDIKQLLKEFRIAAQNAQKAGFDGVQLHGAHGYIIDGFLKDGSNKRTDEYGGSVENRSRLCLQVIDELITVFGAQRVAIQLSPCSKHNFDTTDSEPIKLYSYLVGQLDKRGLSFIEFNQINETNQIPNICAQFRPLFKGVLVANWGFNATTGLEVIQSGVCQMVSFGKLAISNPDLVSRIKNNQPLNNQWDYKTFFMSHNPGSPEPGYNDYPTYQEEELMFSKRSYFDEIMVGDLKIPNRIMMAALTRMRADPQDGVPTDSHVQYYSDRAGFGIILTECSQVSPMGEAFLGSCGIYSEAQTAGWKRVVDQVHEKGGRIFLQIWHSGRATDTGVNHQNQIWGPSAIPINSDHPRLQKPYQTPKAMTLDDIKQVIKEFRLGAQNAQQAGFDGVELHGAHGYLIDEFLKDGSNQRSDEYGGSVENRARLCLQVIDQLIPVFTNRRVGIQLSPCSKFNFDTTDSDPIVLHNYLISQLQKKHIAFIEFNQTNDTKQIQNPCAMYKQIFTGVLVANWGYNEQTGIEFIRTGAAQMVSFGQLAISNPDLVHRIHNNLPINNDFDFKTFYTPGEKGYNDYPTYEQELLLKQN